MEMSGEPDKGTEDMSTGRKLVGHFIGQQLRTSGRRLVNLRYGHTWNFNLYSSALSLLHFSRS